MTTLPIVFGRSHFCSFFVHCYQPSPSGCRISSANSPPEDGFSLMKTYRLLALRPIEISATFAGSEGPQILRLEPGEEYIRVTLIHRVFELEGIGQIDTVPLPDVIGSTVSVEGLVELERLPN